MVICQYLDAGSQDYLRTNVFQTAIYENKGLRAEHLSARPTQLTVKIARIWFAATNAQLRHSR